MNELLEGIVPGVHLDNSDSGDNLIHDTYALIRQLCCLQPVVTSVLQLMYNILLSYQWLCMYSRWHSFECTKNYHRKCRVECLTLISYQLWFELYNNFFIIVLQTQNCNTQTTRMYYLILQKVPGTCIYTLHVFNNFIRMHTVTKCLH